MDLSSAAGLIQACNQVVEARQSDPRYQDWTDRLSAQLAAVRQAPEPEFRSPGFQQRLWENEAISATGIGNVPTRELWQDPTAVDLLWRVKSIDDTLDSDERTQKLISDWDALVAHIRDLGQRIPRLKLARAFAALKPVAFTTVASNKALSQLAKAMQVGATSEHVVLLNRHILERIDSVLAGKPIAENSDWRLLRMKLPWMLYETTSHEPAKGITIEAGEQPGTIKLTPLPASRRRRGLLAIAGGFASILAMLQFVEDGCSRTDFRDHIHSINPNLAPGSIDTNINALIGEWGAIHAEGDRITLTNRGRALLESEDPDEVSDWLLTQILGFDNAVYLLKDGPLEQKVLISGIQAVNPGWTSNFAPTAMINWLRGLELVAYSKDDKSLKLTPRGQEWLNRIHWVPGKLESSNSKAKPDESQDIAEHALARPAIAEIIECFPDDLLFPDDLVARLDAGLWSHPRRHFAVLAGLSGSGKTQLAVNYAKALWHGETSAPGAKGLYVFAVQPGWYDPSAVLGYVDPLRPDRYVRTGFLNFLLDAVRDPDRLYTVVLDEMNLSHPEQYLAPLLSAMETGGKIELHAQGDEVDEIPSSVTYPANLIVIGTINMDETTHGLSDKVLDRASVIEFWDIDVDTWPGWEKTRLPDEQRDRLRQVLRDLVSALAPVRLHFGWRTIEDIAGYVTAACGGGAIAFVAAMDQAIHAKVLPKLRGEDSPSLRQSFEQAMAVLKGQGLRQSQAKLEQLCEELARSGIARFWR